MNIKLMNEMTESALYAKLNFGEIVGQLSSAGVESYRVDFVRKEIVYYMPNGENCVTPLNFKNHPLHQDFDQNGIQNAIKASQRNEQTFVDFITRALDAGVSSYTVYIHGKKVIYFGRKGEMHIELFPQV